MKISASIYSNRSESIQDLAKYLDKLHVDYIHIDSKEATEVFVDIETIRKHSNIPIDLHIIAKSPEPFTQLIEDYAVESVCFQFEDLENKDLTFLDSLNCKKGIAILNQTPLSMIEDQGHHFNYILIMTTTPGVSGGKFDQSTFDKVKEVKAKYPNKEIYVDGGVDDKIAVKLMNLGVDCSISGSYLMKAHEIDRALISLKNNIQKLDISISDFMLKKNELPIVDIESVSLKSIINTITKYKLAFAVILNRSGTLRGIVTDGDLRREIIENIHDLNAIEVDEMINEHPISIQENSTFSDALGTIRLSEKKITFLVVLDNNNKFRGILHLNQIFK